MYKISFIFDEERKTISEVKIQSVDKTVSVPDANIELEVLDNKLKLSKSALEKLNAAPDDRISIQYISEGVGKSCPVIGKAEVFTDRLDGNRLTKSGTVSFRGEKRTTLLDFGSLFTLEPYKEGIWKLIPTTETPEDLTQEQQDLDNLDSKELDKEIETLMASVEDDLPF